MKALLMIVLFAFSSNVIAEPVLTGSTAPPFVLKNIQGDNIELPTRQKGVEIYFFWATWCPYCKALMPHLQSMQLEYGEKLRIYALHISDDEDPVAFMQENGYNFILLPDADAVMAPYKVRTTPALFLVDRQGVVRFNLYEEIFAKGRPEIIGGHKKNAALKTPLWAAMIRQVIDKAAEDG